MNPLITIIMPVFNAASFIEAAIKSVIGQNYSNWELIIINDGSTDKSESIIKNFSDSRIRYFYKDNEGVSKARNLGLQQMNGKYFCFLDADDTLTVDSLASRVLLFEDEKITFVDGTVLIFDQNMTRSESCYRPTYMGPPLQELIKLSSSCFFGITWMIRRKPGVRYNFDEAMSYAEDLWFYTQLAYEGGDYTFVDAPIYNRRVSATSAMSNLRGLALGYKLYFERVRDLGVAHPKELDNLKKKIRSLCLKWAIKKFDFSIMRLGFQLK